jgi:hypothetical protein
VTTSPTLGQLLRRVLQEPKTSTLRLSPYQWKTVRALAACRTSALGGQLFQCTACGRQHFVAHSCRNRHCPACQATRAADWLEQQAAALLPIPYFHLVFTLPHALNGVVRQNRQRLFDLLFAAATATLLEFGKARLKAQLGVTAVLHTWSQTLLDHYHLHCIVTGGGLGPEQKSWVASSAHYLFAVRALSRMFQGKFLAGLKALYEAGQLQFHGQWMSLVQPAQFAALLREVSRSQWVVYAKRPFAGPKQVLAYLSAYTHRVAISNRRLLSVDGQKVSFTYKDYAHDSRRRTMTLEVEEFVRRFCLHILPERFVKIRHYGLLGNRQRQQRLAQARKLLGEVALLPTTDPLPAPPPNEATTPKGHCPFCGQPTLLLVREVAPAQSEPTVALIDSS